MYAQGANDGTSYSQYSYPQNNQQHPQQNNYNYTQQQPMFPGGFQDVANSFTNAVNNPLVSSVANQKLAEVQDYMMPGASGMWNTLRYYFHVDNKYVLKKARLMVFPWRHGEWGRMQIGDSSSPSFAPAIGDINAPDMYLPVMTFLSYMLCIGGLRGQGNPQILEKTFSTCTLTLFVEMCVMKGGLYVMSMKNPITTLDLVVYSSYKYVGLGASLVLGIFFSKLAIPYMYSIILLYCAACQGFYVFQTLNKVVVKPAHGSETGHKRRFYFIASCAGLQVLTFLFLGYMDEISAQPSPPVLDAN